MREIPHLHSTGFQGRLSPSVGFLTSPHPPIKKLNVCAQTFLFKIPDWAYGATICETIERKDFICTYVCPAYLRPF